MNRYTCPNPTPGGCPHDGSCPGMGGLMVKYRNEMTGRIVELPSEDKWLEASSGWTRVEDPPSAPAKEKNEGSKD